MHNFKNTLKKYLEQISNYFHKYELLIIFFIIHILRILEEAKNFSRKRFLEAFNMGIHNYSSFRDSAK